MRLDGQRGDAVLLSIAGGALCRQTPGRGTVLEQLLEGAVTADASGCENVVGQLCGKEASGVLVVDGLVTRHVEQRGRRGPAHRSHQQIAVVDGSVAAHHRRKSAVATGAQYIAASTSVLDATDLHARGGEVFDGRVARGVGRQHHRACARLDRPQIEETTHSGGQHHSGEVVARKDIGSFDETGSRHQTLGPRLDQALCDSRQAALENGEEVPIVAAGDYRITEDLDAV
jgi:hypothetical protein